MLNKVLLITVFIFELSIIRVNASPVKDFTEITNTTENTTQTQVVDINDMKEAFPYLFPKEKGDEIDLTKFEFWKDTASIELLTAFSDTEVDDQMAIWNDLNGITLSLLKEPTITYKKKAAISSNMAIFYYSLLKRKEFRGWAYPMSSDYLFYFYAANMYGDRSSRKIFKTNHLKLLESLGNTELTSLLRSYNLTNINDPYLAITMEAVDFLHNIIKKNEVTINYRNIPKSIEQYKMKIIEKHHDLSKS